MVETHNDLVKIARASTQKLNVHTATSAEYKQDSRDAKLWFQALFDDEYVSTVHYWGGVWVRYEKVVNGGHDERRKIIVRLANDALLGVTEFPRDMQRTLRENAEILTRYMREWPERDRTARAYYAAVATGPDRVALRAWLKDS